jgi:PAS domain S-box-containing protein
MALNSMVTPATQGSLTEGEQRYRQLIESAAEAMLMVDIEHGIIVDVNQRAVQMLGFHRDALLGRPHESLHPADQLQGCPVAMAGVRSSGSSTYTNLKVLHASGREVDVDIAVSEFRFGDRRILQYIYSEISDRSPADQSLRRTNQALQALSSCNEVLMHASDEVSLLEDICRIIVCIAGYRCAQICRLDRVREGELETVASFGHSEVPGSELQQGDYPEDSQWPGASALRTSSVSVIHDIENDVSSSVWKHHALQMGCRSVVSIPLVVKDSHYGVLVIYSADTDGFDYIALRHLQNLAEDLMFGISSLQMGKERKRLQRQLQQAQKMEAIGQLTGGIAHDFNNMLASIIGYASLSQDIAEQLNNEKLKDFLARVTHAGERARDLIAQMLTFSRGSYGEPVPIDPESLVHEVISMMQSTLPSSTIIDISVEQDLPMILFDPIQFHQVLINLCINARDAMQGEGTIQLSLRRAEVQAQLCASCHNQPDAEYLELLVSDTGEGMEKDIIERVFDPFFSTKEAGKGSGMGLSMVHGIMHENDGHILLDSEPGNGTSFRLLFPLTAKADQCQVRLVPEAEGVSGSACERQGTIMIVDDEEAVAGYMQELFEMHGYRVIVMHDSLKALARFGKNPDACDLVITDLNMPGLSGIALANKLSRLREDIPVIISTGSDEELDTPGQQRPGCVTDVLVKPLTNVQLLEKVARALSGQASPQG